MERLLNIDDSFKRHPARKDRRRWCRGKVGIEHKTRLEPATISRKSGQIFTLVKLCENCGKKLNYYWRPWDGSLSKDGSWESAWSDYRQQENR